VRLSYHEEGEENRKDAVSRGFDPVSTNGKRLAPRERVQLLVVGAGPVGCAAAIEAARLGLKVALVDEHPLDPTLMGLEVPFHFGGRMTGAVRNRNAMTEAIVANDPALGRAFEAGVDVRLGVAVWSLVTPRPGAAWVGRCAAGLSDGAESWFCGHVASWRAS
jgi:choline dehydrogenase-like flavoprotein